MLWLGGGFLVDLEWLKGMGGRLRVQAEPGWGWQVGKDLIHSCLPKGTLFLSPGLFYYYGGKQLITMINGVLYFVRRKTRITNKR